MAKRTTRKPKAAPAVLNNIESNKVQQGEQAMIENKPSTATASAAENGKSTESVVIPPVVEEAPLPPDPIMPVPTVPVPADPEEEKKLLESTWPPPLYLPRTAGIAEKYYLKHRFQGQWMWYDKKAAENKNKHQALQVLIGVGSVAVPVLLTAMEPWRNLAALVSLVVAAAASIENVKKYGDNWRSYRRAAENLSREKALYDVQGGPYKTSKRPFARFVERCEEVIAQQNGQFYQRDEQQTQTQSTSQQQSGRDIVTETETETTISTG